MCVVRDVFCGVPIKDTPEIISVCKFLPKTIIRGKNRKIIFVKIFPDSLGIFEAKFWGGAYALFNFCSGVQKP